MCSWYNDDDATDADDTEVTTIPRPFLRNSRAKKETLEYKEHLSPDQHKRLLRTISPYCHTQEFDYENEIYLI